MTRDLIFRERGWNDYLYWQTQDRKTLKRINQLLSEVVRTPFAGTGKPEQLKGNMSGLWSRRIDEKNRLVYHVEETKVAIFICRGHYTDK